MDESRFIECVWHNPVNRTILGRLPALGLPDVWLVSGCLFQTVWNVLTGRMIGHGIRDYDVFYFDDSDLSWEAEDAAIRRAGIVFADLGVKIELRNEARAHLWYPEKFGVPYPALSQATEGIDRFLLSAAQVGMRVSFGSVEVYAPRGFEDIAAMVIRPNCGTANFRADLLKIKVDRWKLHWPELTVLLT